MIRSYCGTCRRPTYLRTSAAGRPAVCLEHTPRLPRLDDAIAARAAHCLRPDLNPPPPARVRAG